MNKIKLYVIIPDVSSGDYFNAKLRKQNIETEYGYYKIRPRVINNKLTTSLDVVADMNAIFKTFTDKTRSVVIACNTLAYNNVKSGHCPDSECGDIYTKEGLKKQMKKLHKRVTEIFGEDGMPSCGGSANNNEGGGGCANIFN